MLEFLVLISMNGMHLDPTNGCDCGWWIQIICEHLLKTLRHIQGYLHKCQNKKINTCELIGVLIRNVWTTRASEYGLQNMADTFKLDREKS